MTMFRVRILSKQYNVDGPPRARHFIYSSSSHTHGPSKRQVMVNPVVKKLSNSEGPETQSLLGLGQGFEPRLSGSISHSHTSSMWSSHHTLSAKYTKTIQTHCPLTILKHILIFTLMENDPKVDYHRFFYLLLFKINFHSSLTFEVCIFSSAGFLTAKQTPAYHHYVFILM